MPSSKPILLNHQPVNLVFSQQLDNLNHSEEMVLHSKYRSHQIFIRKNGKENLLLKLKKVIGHMMLKDHFHSIYHQFLKAP